MLIDRVMKNIIYGLINSYLMETNIKIVMLP